MLAVLYILHVQTETRVHVDNYLSARACTTTTISCKVLLPPPANRAPIIESPGKGERRSDAICSCPRLRYGLSSAQPSRQHL